MFVKVTSGYLFARLTSAPPALQPDFNYSISVKDIVSDCGVNRNTFYYYFEDIPKLVEDIIVEDAEHIIQEFPSMALIEDCLNAMIDFSLKHGRCHWRTQYRFPESESGLPSVWEM